MTLPEIPAQAHSITLCLPSSADSGDFAFFYDALGAHWLAYETQRDFLSSPRAFAILRLNTGPADWVFLTDDNDEPSPSGLSLLHAAPWHLQLRSGTRLLDISAQALTLLGTRYQHAGAATALQEAMQTMDGDTADAENFAL